MELNREHFRAIIFYNFRSYNSTSMNLNKFLANSTEVVVHSKTKQIEIYNQYVDYNFAKTIQECSMELTKVM